MTTALMSTSVSFLPQLSSALNLKSILSLQASSSTEERIESDGKRSQTESDKGNKRIINATASIVLPFSSTVAFEFYSDLTRQPSWSPWLRSVKYLEDSVGFNGERETEWTLAIRGLNLCWRAVGTVLDPPNEIAWVSTSGLKNEGNVIFQTLDEENPGVCKMTLSMAFVAPRVLAS
eukprot:CAMPEP_0195522098 /NCGR_PEP_ID=MMETSP0794_2-20130614/20041_1 /TAXON_ID=515487 /ORGANISM="Stephanopyxis turris, Strain CCMP 815" /LENGTH=176 /DNA_ID=CAMNT_0040651785 /DNA_START=44 /DNA_END=571 /DNA_ORIENTATION=+